jgi:hypothetical protein
MFIGVDSISSSRIWLKSEGLVEKVKAVVDVIQLSRLS